MFDFTSPAPPSSISQVTPTRFAYLPKMSLGIPPHDSIIIIIIIEKYEI
jgi:hypothetical protein